MNKYNIQKQPNSAMLEVAERHKKIRKSQKLSQMELAERSGVSLGSLKRFETTGHISFESLLKLAHFFNRLEEFDGVFVFNNTEELHKLFDTKKP